MNEEYFTEIEPIANEQLPTIDEEKLPEMFHEQCRFLENANSEYIKAEYKEKQAREKVEQALIAADDLISAAKNIGGHTAEIKKFFGKAYTTDKGEIIAIKKNLKEIIDHSEDSAEAQKRFVEVECSLMESQTALLQVQKAHMEYQRQIAETTKFVFGLCAYNMATSQSVLINLRAILNGASKKKLGELAQQQLFLALDQIKNQENIINRINDNNASIKKLNLEIEHKQKEILEINQIYEEQDKRISENASVLEEHEKILSEQYIKDTEHDRRFAEMDETDKEQDRILHKHGLAIKQQEKKDEEFEKLFAEQTIEDKKQDEKIAQNISKISNHDIRLDKVDVKDRLQDEEMKRQAEENERLKTETIRQAKKDEEHDMRLDAGDKKDRLQDEEIKHYAEENQLLKAEAERQAKIDEEHDNSIAELNKKIQDLQIALSKKGNKNLLIITSCTSVAALIISILHFFI